MRREEERNFLIIFVLVFLMIMLTYGTGCAPKNGKDGATGAIGSTGPSGSPGAAGPQGNEGPSGPQGSMGPMGPAGSPGVAGNNGLNGVDASPTTIVQLCPGVTSYPGVFVEVAICLQGSLYGVYSDHGGFLTYLPPGRYSSNGIGSACNLTIQPDCVVTH